MFVYSKASDDERCRDVIEDAEASFAAKEMRRNSSTKVSYRKQARISGTFVFVMSLPLWPPTR